MQYVYLLYDWLLPGACMLMSGEINLPTAGSYNRPFPEPLRLSGFRSAQHINQVKPGQMFMACKAPACEQFGLPGKGIAPVCRVTATTPGIKTIFLCCAVGGIVNMGNIAKVIAQQVIVSCCTALVNSHTGAW